MKKFLLVFMIFFTSLLAERSIELGDLAFGIGSDNNGSFNINAQYFFNRDKVQFGLDMELLSRSEFDHKLYQEPEYLISGKASSNRLGLVVKNNINERVYVAFRSGMNFNRGSERASVDNNNYIVSIDMKDGLYMALELGYDFEHFYIKGGNMLSNMKVEVSQTEVSNQETIETNINHRMSNFFIGIGYRI